MGPEMLKCERAPWFRAEKPENRQATYRDTVAAVCREYDLDPEQVNGRCRTSRLVTARHDVWFRLHRRGWCSSEIARHAGRDHTTVMSALDKVRKVG